jgi:ribonuclease HI
MTSEPKPVRYTITVDASCDDRLGIVGIGLIVQETDKPGRRGPIIDQFAEAYRGVPPGSGELFAVFRALELATERGFRRVKVRLDYNYMRKTLKKLHSRQEGQDGNDLQATVLRLATGFDEVRFAYTPRRKNHIAHRLANEARKQRPVVYRNDLFPLPTSASSLSSQDTNPDSWIAPDEHEWEGQPAPIDELDPFEEDPEKYHRSWEDPYGVCIACETDAPLSDMSLCGECAVRLERDLIRQRDWDYSVSVYGLPTAAREKLRQEVIRRYGSDLELISPEPSASKEKPPRRRRR